MVAGSDRAVATIGLAAERRLVALLARSLPRVQVFAMGGGLDSGLGRTGPGRRPGHVSASKTLPISLAARVTSLPTGSAQPRCAKVGARWAARRRAVVAGAGAPNVRAARLMDFASVLHLPGCRFIDLQYGDTTAERDVRCAARPGSRSSVSRRSTTPNDIDGLACLIAACDAVVTISNVTAHLAGALGTPTFAFVPFENGWVWYWFRDRPRQPLVSAPPTAAPVPGAGVGRSGRGIARGRRERGGR